jgi:hypothetical protein
VVVGVGNVEIPGGIEAAAAVSANCSRILTVTRYTFCRNMSEALYNPSFETKQWILAW